MVKKDAKKTNIAEIVVFLDIKFTDDMSFEEFQNKLKEYAENSPYPNIDN